MGGSLLLSFAVLVGCWGFFGGGGVGGGGGGERKERGGISGRAKAGVWGGGGVHVCGMMFNVVTAAAGVTAAQEAGGKEVR